jgi:hypothetical protein
MTPGWDGSNDWDGWDSTPAASTPSGGSYPPAGAHRGRGGDMNPDRGRRVPRSMTPGSGRGRTDGGYPSGGSLPPGDSYMPDDSYRSGSSYPPSPGHRRKRRQERVPRRRNWAPHIPRHLWSRVLAAAIVVILIPTGWSVGHALTMPGGGAFSARMAEWARDHYLGALVTLGEKLTYQPPKVGGKPSFALTGPSVASAKAARKDSHGKPGAAVASCPANLRTFAGKPLPGEGVWRVLGTVNGQPAICGTDLRFSKVFTSYVAGIASMNQSLVKFELRPGTLDPGPGNWKAPDYIPAGTRRGLMATFNSGFRLNVSGGGFYLNGERAGTLTRGVASEVYYRDGHIAIGVWGQTVHMTPDVVGVRQNLHLIVINGRVPNSVDNNVTTAWGATLGGGYNVWRSGIGITKDGRVIWVYGPALNVRQLASLLRRAGAVTAMQLDINPAWMSYEYYLHSQRANPKPVNLLPNQQEPADRYYFPNSRDFTAVYAK